MPSEILQVIDANLLKPNEQLYQKSRKVHIINHGTGLALCVWISQGKTCMKSVLETLKKIRLQYIKYQGGRWTVKQECIALFCNRKLWPEFQEKGNLLLQINQTRALMIFFFLFVLLCLYCLSRNLHLNASYQFKLSFLSKFCPQI